MSKPTRIAHLHAFTRDISRIKAPERFTFPYYYTPHKLAEFAMSELQIKLTRLGVDDASKGNMYGVLVVADSNGELGYLAAHAGKITLTQEQNDGLSLAFVPSVFDFAGFTDASLSLNKQIEEVSENLRKLRADILTSDLSNALHRLELESKASLTKVQESMAASKIRRQQIRQQVEQSGDVEKIASVIAELGKESSQEKRALKSLKQEIKQSKAALEQGILSEQQSLERLIEQEQTLHAELELIRLEHFQFLNASLEKASLKTLLNGHSALPNTGECCAPKLLNHAFKNGLKPLALAEFWWGSLPKAEVRQHGNLYPVCQSKCFEILEHMLQGMLLEDNPLIVTPSLDKELDIVYQDEVMVVVNKPEEFLSVPGKFIEDSVYTRIKAQYPNATGPLIVHRLDMSTSGLLVLTLTAETNKHVQQQFINRTVEKRYTALLDGLITHESGTIKLPLSGDITDRPRQLVCEKNGRKAETKWEVVEQNNGKTKVHLYPKTGRTHQLRVHCAHPLGLGVPITGDDLYGYKLNRLHLHAGYLKLAHPVSGKVMEFEVPEEF